MSEVCLLWFHWVPSPLTLKTPSNSPAPVLLQPLRHCINYITSTITFTNLTLLLTTGTRVEYAPDRISFSSRSTMSIPSMFDITLKECMAWKSEFLISFSSRSTLSKFDIILNILHMILKWLLHRRGFA